MPIESGLIRKNATRTIGLCCIFHYVSATQNLRRNKEKRRGVLMVKSGIEKIKIHKKISEYSLYSLDKSEYSVYNKSNILWEESP